MKHTKRFIGSLLALILCVNGALPVSAASFPDVDESAEYAEAVEYLADVGIFAGDEKGNFNPNKAVTRAEMAVIVCKMLGETEDLTRSTTFTDLPYDHWANPYVTRAAEVDIISGYGNGKFGPSDPVNYEQALTMLIRAMGGVLEADESGGYPDGYIAVAYEVGLLKNVYANKGESLQRSNVALIVFNAIILSQ